MNKIVAANNRMQKIISKMTGKSDGSAEKRAELMKNSKEQLVDMLMDSFKTRTVKVEDIAEAVLCDPACAWLTYEQIALAICQAIPDAKTSSKSIASYVSKKGWDTQKRVSASERQTELMKLVNV